MSNSIISEPQVTLDIIPAVQQAQLTDQKVLFVHQMTTGTATAGTLVENIGVQGEEDALFGADSLLAIAIRAARILNKTTRFDALPLADNGSGVAATATLAFTGPATAAGTITLSIGSLINYTYDITVTNSMTATQIGAAVIAAINADTRCPVNATNDTGTVTLTAVNKGTTGNKYGILIDVSGVTGVAVTVTGFASGATNPSLTTVFDPIDTARYQTVVWPGSYTYSTVINFLDGRFNSDNAVLDGVAISGYTDTYANHITTLGTLNSKSFVYFANKTVNSTYYKGSALFELDDVIAAQFAALRSLRLTTNANIANIVISSQGALDSFGGIAISSLPYANTPFSYLPLIPTSRGFITQEITAINAAHGSVIANNPAGNTTICGRVFTTYKTNSAGNVDSSYEFLNYVDTLSSVREFFWVNLRQQYAQSRLTSGALEPGRNMANAGSISGFIDSLYISLAKEALVADGQAALAFFKQNRVVTLDLASGSAIVTMVVPIVVQLRTIMGTIQLSFQNFGS